MVEYSLINVLTLLLGAGLLANGYRLVRGGREDVSVFLVSAVIGIGLMIVAIVPGGVFASTADVLGVRLEAVAVLVVSNLVLFVIITFLFDRIGRLKSKISRLNEELSLLRQQVEENE